MPRMYFHVSYGASFTRGKKYHRNNAGFTTGFLILLGNTT